MRAYRHVNGRGRHRAYFFESGTAVKPFFAPFMKSARDTVKSDDTPIWEIQSYDAEYVACVFSLSKVIDGRRSGYSDYLLLDSEDTCAALEAGVERLLDFTKFLDAEEFITLDEKDREGSEPWKVDDTFVLPKEKWLPDLRDHLDLEMLGQLAVEYWIRIYERYQKGTTVSPVGVCLPGIEGIKDMREAGQALLRFLHSCLPSHVRRLVSITIDGVWALRNSQSGSALFLCRNTDKTNVSSEGFYDFTQGKPYPNNRRPEDKEFAEALISGKLDMLPLSPYLWQEPGSFLKYDPVVYRFEYRAFTLREPGAKQPEETAFALWTEYAQYLQSQSQYLKSQSSNEAVTAQQMSSMLWPVRKLAHDMANSDAAKLNLGTNQVRLLLTTYIQYETKQTRSEENESPESYHELLLRLSPAAGYEALNMLLEIEIQDNGHELYTKLVPELMKKYACDISLDDHSREHFECMREIISDEKLFLELFGQILLDRLLTTARLKSQDLPCITMWVISLYGKGNPKESYRAFAQGAGDTLQVFIPLLLEATKNGGLVESLSSGLLEIYLEQNDNGRKGMRDKLLLGLKGHKNVLPMERFLLRFSPKEWEEVEAFDDEMLLRWRERRMALQDQAVRALAETLERDAAVDAIKLLALVDRWNKEAEGIVADARLQLQDWSTLADYPYLKADSGFARVLIDTLGKMDIEQFMKYVEKADSISNTDDWYRLLLLHCCADAFVGMIDLMTPKAERSREWKYTIRQIDCLLREYIPVDKQNRYYEAWGRHERFWNLWDELARENQCSWVYFKIVQSAVQEKTISSEEDFRELLGSCVGEPLPLKQDALIPYLYQSLWTSSRNAKVNWGCCLESILGTQWRKVHLWKDAHPYIQCIVSLLECLRNEEPDKALFDDFCHFLDSDNTAQQFRSSLLDTRAMRTTVPGYLKEVKGRQREYMPEGIYTLLKERMT